MKKTVSVNLGGFVFNIDEDAYNELQIYLSLIEKHFRHDQGRQEIIDDIEARIAELFRDKTGSGKQVINIGDVQEIIKIMGKPEEMGEGENEEYQQEVPYDTGRRSYRRIYRDPDNRIIGGVCSGLAAYWQFDPLILRIIFIVAFLGFGVGLFIYLILWIVIPEAKTVAQKLEMRGEPVTASNIGKAVRDEFNNIRKNMKF